MRHQLHERTRFITADSAFLLCSRKRQDPGLIGQTGAPSGKVRHVLRHVELVVDFRIPALVFRHHEVIEVEPACGKKIHRCSPVVSLDPPAGFIGLQARRRVIGRDDLQVPDVGMHNTEMIEPEILSHHVECVRECIWLEDGGLKPGDCFRIALQIHAAIIKTGQSSKTCLNSTSRLLPGDHLNRGLQPRTSCCMHKPLFAF